MNSKKIQYNDIEADDQTNVTESYVMASIVFCYIILGVVPNVTYLCVACYYLNDECFEDDNNANLVHWLFVESIISFLLLALFLGLLASNYDNAIFRSATGDARDIYAVKLIAIFLMLISFFHIVWCPIGALRLSEDERCKKGNLTLYITTLFAVTLGLLEILFNMSFHFWYTRKEQ